MARSRIIAVAILDIGGVNEAWSNKPSVSSYKKVALLAFDPLARIIAMRIDTGPPFSALLTLWLSMMAAVGLASRRLAHGTPHKSPPRPSDERPFLAPTTSRPTVVGFGVLSDIADMMSAFFSMSGLSSAIRTVAINRTQPTAATADDGFAPIPLAPHHFSVRNVFNFVLHTGLLQRGGRVSLPMITAAREMIATCDRYQVDCRFFISPLHADVLFAMYHLGLWPEMENLKRGLAELAPTYDFTRYSPLIEERTGPVVYWPEAFHFSPALGELMVRAMTGLRTPDMPQNFGVLIESKNIESSLTAWRQERDDWIAQHPDLVERMRKAEDDFRRGVPFQAVTDAEIAAGGW